MKRAALFIVCVLTCGIMLSGTALAAKEITFLFMPDAPQDVYLPWMQEKAANFEAETGVKVNVEVVSWGDAWTRISTTVATGEGADVFQVGTTWNPQFAATGGLAEVDIAEFGGKDVFMPANLDSTTYKGKHYGVRGLLKPVCCSITRICLLKPELQNYPNLRKTLSRWANN